METREYFEKVMQDYNQNRNGRSLRKYSCVPLVASGKAERPAKFLEFFLHIWNLMPIFANEHCQDRKSYDDEGRCEER